ncbi:hypothetical protein L292_2772 [Acinetobacter junii CIP 107470 = MTCC 11364]|uniref:Uncharacterized protein n=1 Tax=Acinetobacter junii CIP 107470 = MTCC 11364 TaxID=1217666 RepID=S7WSU4_ACIJU|nr:hypothetical protein L292_2772 [Acinetobacter junii CIP 107470 = MTCC 11364]
MNDFRLVKVQAGYDWKVVFKIHLKSYIWVNSKLSEVCFLII